MEILEDKRLPEQTIALLKILQIGQSQIEQGQVKTMEVVFEELDKLN
ncbi:MAG: hypothetical protein PSV17_11270 [Methylotenera sp.]|nr:hypothetical protein [Methylotenera sp.]MDI1309993.1 hypothetical protein [Methylotenera sp.]